MSNVLKEIANEPGTYIFFCPGCDEHHQVWTDGKHSANWTFNGDKVKPTFSPSLLIRGVWVPKEFEKDENGKLILGEDGRVKGAKDSVCHSFIRNGQIQYLGDCTHSLANQTVPLPEIDKV